MDNLNAIVEFFNLRTILVLALVFVPLERILHLHEDQKILRQTLSVDAIYFFVIAQITRLGLGLVTLVAMAGVNLVMPAAVGDAIRSQHLVLQVIEALVIADIGLYLAHRMFHAVPLLWRFHAVHHSSEQLDWMSAYRVHPVDQVLTKAISLLPIFALGYSTEAVAILFVIQTAHAVLVHANIRIGFGPLKWLLVTPQFHHWHHANERQAYDKNFAAQLAFLDWLGGTMHLPGKSYPKAYGADDAPPVDQPLRQLADPFLPRPKPDSPPQTAE
ncbi:sterol desaturase family protein [Devosia sp.]|uniref:sterol desaturase family protein n=1 Tax=Devosia sp. TaxID=1871048 RepID=UPI00326736FE